VRTRGAGYTERRAAVARLGSEVNSLPNTLHNTQYTNILFMYLRAILCTFQISIDFYFVPVGGRGGGRGGLERRGGARQRGIECILYGYSQCVNCTRGYS
jgi:hypothetical protein